MQQRYYDPGIGRFDSVDPVTAYDDGDMRFFNRYAYAFNNAYRFTDPNGRQSVPVPFPVPILPLPPSPIRPITQNNEPPPDPDSDDDDTRPRPAGKPRPERDYIRRDRNGNPISISSGQSTPAPPPPDDDDRQRNNNQAQNKQFNDATRGLTREQKELVHREISGENLSYQEIKAIAEAIKNGKF